MSEDTDQPVVDEDLSLDTGVDDAAEADDADQDQIEDGSSEDEEPPEETEEVEHDGQKYKLPKALKPALMMQADYTKKTQELAEQRRAFEAEAKNTREADEEHLTGRAKLIGMDDTLAQYAKVDWDALAAQDAEAANAHWRKYQLLKDQRSAFAEEFKGKQGERVLKAQQEAAKRQQEGLETLQRDIPGWSPKLVEELKEFAGKKYGLTPARIAAIEDPAFVRAIHDAMQATKAQKTATRIKPIEAAATARPVPRAGSSASPPTGLSDSLSADEWARRRNAQLAKRGH